MPRTLGDRAVREVPVLREDEEVGEAVRAIAGAGVPALPVADRTGRLKGIFGEREFIAALFPGYIGELGYAAFVPRSLDQALYRRAECRFEPVSKYMNTEHVEVGADFSDAQLAEIFLHHDALIVPVLEGERVRGVVTRSDFFRALGDRFAEGAGTADGA